MPVTVGWPDPWLGNPPPDPTDTHLMGSGEKHEVCTSCHSHANEFIIPGNSCLVCHTATGVAASMNIDARFDGIGSQLANGMNSQHNIAYTADGDTTTPDTVAENECYKCHGRKDAGGNYKHPSASEYLTYPDDVTGGVVGGGVHTAGDSVQKATDGHDYQDFCLACHDGVHRSVDPDYPVTFQQFNVVSVPPVPPKDYNRAAPYTTQSPYFAYYETNGHGIATGMSGLPANYGCSYVAGGDGCHAPHGTTNRYLIDDAGNFDGGVGMSGSGYTAVSEFARGVCYACHTALDLSLPDFSGGYVQNFFHTWRGDDTVVHDEGDPAAGLEVGVAEFKTLSDGFMDIVLGGTSRSQVLPFYGGPAAEVMTREYASPTLGDGGTTVGSYLACQTCHDVHGTSLSWAHNEGPGNTTDSTQGMLRVFPRTWDYGDPLCSECHDD